MLISDAFAEPPATTATTQAAPPVTVNGAAPEAAPSPFAGMGILLLIPIILYVLVFRPNQKKIKEFETMVKSINRGDRVVTGGGIIGLVTKIENDDVLVVEIAPEVKVRVMRETISNVINKTAVNDNKTDDKAAKKTDVKV